jgi:hypothetical protein
LLADDESMSGYWFVVFLFMVDVNACILQVIGKLLR